MIPNIPPKIFSLSAIAVGYILLDDATAREQNALGNWLMLVAQLLCTNAFYRQVREERGLENQNINNVREKSQKEETIEMLEKLLKAIEEELKTKKKEM